MKTNDANSADTAKNSPSAYFWGRKMFPIWSLCFHPNSEEIERALFLLKGKKEGEKKYTS